MITDLMLELETSNVNLVKKSDASSKNLYNRIEEMLLYFNSEINFSSCERDYKFVSLVEKEINSIAKLNVSIANYPHLDLSDYLSYIHILNRLNKQKPLAIDWSKYDY